MAGPDRVYLKRTEKYSAFVGEELQQIRRDLDFTDFQITVHETAFPCHKVTIAVHSPVLKAMLKSKMYEVAKQSIKLDHIPMDIMETILDFIYVGEISFDAEQIMGMIEAAHYLQMRLLQEMCVDEIPSHLKSSNVISWLQLGKELDIPEITSHCSEFMVSRFTDIVAEPYFIKMTSAEVLDYLREATRTDTERDDILRAAMLWVNHDAANRLTDLENLLQQVELDKCSLQNIVDIMSTYGAMIGPHINVLNLLTEAMKQGLSRTEQRTAAKAQNKTPEDTKKQKALVIVGGNANHNASHLCWKLNEQNQFTKLCDIPFKALASNHSACKCPQGFIITGGERSDLCIMYIAATKSWTKLKKLLRKREHHGSICVNGVLYVLGGCISGDLFNKSDSVDCLDNGTWQSGPNVPMSVKDPKVADINGKVFLLDGLTKQLLQLCTNMNAWNRCASWPGSDVSDATMISMQDNLLLAGGFTSVCGWYIPSTNTWCMSQAPKVHGHCHGALVYHNNTILLLGGNRWTSGSTDAVEEYSKNGTWSVSNIKMPASLQYHHAFVIDMPHED